jgi:4'-phosphopantetheinyl transferase
VYCLKILPPLLAEDNIHIWWVSLHASREIEKAFEKTLSDKEMLRGQAFVNSRLRRRFTLSHGVLRVLLGRYLDTCPSNVALGCGRAGKPFVKNEKARIEFNMSHSDDLAVYAFANGCRLGIDIERPRSMPDREAVAKQFFNQREYAELRTVEKMCQEEAFFRCWTRKEAYIKAVGQGLTLALNSFQVSVRPEQAAAFRLLPTGDSCQTWKIRDIAHKGYVGAIVFDGECHAVEQQLLCTAEDLA